MAIPLFFLSSLPSDEPLSLESFKELIAGTYLKRFDEQIAELDASRRKGRPKDGKQLELEEKRRREGEEWKGSGIGENVRLTSLDPPLLSCVRRGP